MRKVKRQVTESCDMEPLHIEDMITEIRALDKYDDKLAAAKKLLKDKEKMNISDTIRYLASEGVDRKVIAMVVGKRYQHVRNVLVTPLKRHGKTHKV